MRERGEEVRVDDTPEVLTKRLASYRSQTEPLIHYYSERRKLSTIDGMMAIDEVTRAIHRQLLALGAVEPKTHGRSAAKASPAKTGVTKAKTAKKPPKTAKKPAKSAKKAAKKAAKGTKKAAKKTVKKAVKTAAKKTARKAVKKGAKKAAKKVTKKRAKR
jgi:adenylate kinase